MLKRLLVGIALSGLMSPGLTQSVGPLAVEDRSALVNDRASANASSAVSDDALMMLMQQLQQYEQELGSLRSQIDEMRHEIEMMKSAERERYLDLDTRLNALTTRSGNGSGNPPVNPSTAGAPAASAASEVDQEQDRASYMAARELLYASKFDQARDAFSRYLKQFPSGQFRDFSHFWLGEAYRNQSKPAPDKAMAEFVTVIEQYPDSSRVPSALYRLAVLQAEGGDKGAARVRLQQILDRFPNSSEAGYARTMLEQLK